MFHNQVNLSVNLNKPVIPLLMEKMDWPPRGSMGPIFSEYLFIRFFQRQSEETEKSDQRYWPIPKFTELLMQLNFYVVPDAKMIQKGEYCQYMDPIKQSVGAYNCDFSLSISLNMCQYHLIEMVLLSTQNMFWLRNFNNALISGSLFEYILLIIHTIMNINRPPDKV